MQQFVKLIEDALKAGDRRDAQFRRSVYEAAMKAFEKTATENAEPELYQSKYRQQIADAITDIERQVLEAERAQAANAVSPDQEVQPQSHNRDPAEAVSETVQVEADMAPEYVRTVEPGLEPIDGALDSAEGKSGFRTALRWLIFGLLALIVLAGLAYWFMTSILQP